MSTGRALIEINDLAVDYRQDGGWRQVIHNLSLSIPKGEVQGLAGESGCGKSTLAALMLGEKRGDRRVRSGTVNFAGIDLLSASPKSLREIRGARVAFVPQNAGTSLTPTQRIGILFSELIRTHRPGVNSAERDNLILRSLAEVGLEDPGTLLKRYPHQFSGGQQQRISLALALCVSPELLVLDEPTTGQDAITSRGIVRLLSGLHRSRSLTMLFVSHDLAVLGEICSRIAIMYAGEIVENGPAAEVLENPRHPYSQALIASQPTLASPPRSMVKERAAV